MLLFRKGVFSRLDGDRSGVNGHNADVVGLWRKVLDEMLIAWVSTNTSASQHSEKWFNSKPGDKDYFLDDETGIEYEVDMHEEFKEVCSMAELDHVLVHEAANRAYETIMEETRNERKKKKNK